MGVERAVTRWHVQRQSLLLEMKHLESQLEHSSPQKDEQASGTKEVDVVALSHQLKMAQEKLQLMGQCPRPMMG